MRTLLLFLLIFLNAMPAFASSSFPQIKVDGVEWVDGHLLRVYATFLDGRRRPVALEQLSDVDVMFRQGKSRPEPQASFRFGVATEVQEAATILPRAKSETVLGLAVIAPATLAAPWMNPALDAHLRKGVAAIFKELAATDKANLLWVGDHVFTYIPSEGKDKELSNLSDRYDECADTQSWSALHEMSEEGAKAGAELNDLHEEACGLVTSHGELSGIVESLQGYGGYYPDLFRVRFPLPDVAPEHQRQVILGTRKHSPDSAMDEAFKMLLKPSASMNRRALVLISDGLDGYLQAEADAKLRFRERDCPKQLDDTGSKRGSSAKKMTECVNGKLDQFRAAEQTRFREEASRWLALSHAVGIQIHGVGVQSSMANPEFLTDRIQVLSVESGGTYREASGPNGLYEALTDLAAELSGQYVIELKPSFLPGEERALRLKAKVDGGHAFQSQDFPVTMPVPRNSWIPDFVGQRLAGLQGLVGFYWYRAIVLAVVIGFGLLFLWGVWKAIKGLRKKLKKMAEKKKKALKKSAKAAMKGGAGGKKK